MAVGGKIEIRPMMYLALSYDHRIVDGQRGGVVPGAGEGRRRGPAPAAAGRCDMSRKLRRHRHRRRPRRLCLRHPRRPARHEGGLRRKARHARRHLPQCRLHPVQGAAAIVGEFHRADARVGRPRHRWSAGVKLDLARMQARKGEVVTANVKGVEFLFRKNKVTWLKGTGRIVAPGQGRGRRHRVRRRSTSSSPPAAKACRCPASTVDEKRIVTSTGALELDASARPSGGDRRRRDRPGTRQRLAPAGRRGDGGRVPRPHRPRHGRARSPPRSSASWRSRG